MKKIYRVIAADNLDDLEKKVTAYLNFIDHNWKLVGGVAINNDSFESRYLQAMEDWP